MNWQSYSPEAFEEAANSGKLMLLFISTPWCHWCQVMQDTTLKDKEVIEAIEKNCIPMKVDADKEPHVADRYQLGGFPSFVLLAPNGDMIGGDTFMDKEATLALLEKIVGFIEETQTIPASDALKKRLQTFEHNKPATKLDFTLYERFYPAIEPSLDPNGSLKGAPKVIFPKLVELELNEEKGKVHAHKTLTKAVQLADENGGFYRLAEKEDWSNPHKERMLAYNAQMIALLEGLDDPELKEAQQKAIAVFLKHQKNLFPQALLEKGTDAAQYTNANAQMISALLKTEDKKAHKAAMAALEYLIKHRVQEDVVLHDEETKNLLTDYVYLIQALLDATQHSNQTAYLALADKLAKATLNKFLQENKALKDHANEPLGQLEHNLSPIPENMVMAKNLHRLAIIKHDTNYAIQAKHILLKFQPVIGHYGPLAAEFMLVLKEVQNEA